MYRALEQGEMIYLSPKIIKLKEYIFVIYKSKSYSKVFDKLLLSGRIL